MASPEWCTIESDPAVFTELICKFGVQDVEVSELYNLEDSDFKRLSPMHGLIFLFKWDQSMQTNIASNALDVVPEGVFFAKQMIHNACATQAILSVLLNRSKQIELGKTLNNFMHFTADLDPESRGIALGSSEEIRTAHNSFSRPEPISIERAKDDEEGEAFHFISYVPINGFLYEIDGLQKGPRLIDSCDENDWFGKARTVLQQRMAQYSAKELRFTLLAIVKNQKKKYNEELVELQKQANPNTERIEELKKSIENEQIKETKWEKENIRRRHNYFPFILNLIRVMAEKGVLKNATDKAVEKKKEKIKRMEEEKAKQEKAEKEAKEKEKEKAKDSNETDNSKPTTDNK